MKLHSMQGARETGLSSLSITPKLAAHLFTLAALVMWFLASLALPPYLIPGPTLVARTLWGMVSDRETMANVYASILHVGIALIASFIVGTLLAILSREIQQLDILIRHRILPFINSFPGVGWALLALVWFGIGSTSVIFTITLVLTPLAIINMRAAIDSVDHELIEMGASFGRSKLELLRLIVFPSVVPYAFATFRINFGTAWKITLTAELFGGGAGLGFLLNIARQGFDMSTIFAIFAVIMSIIYVVDRVIFAPLQRLLGEPNARES